MPGKDAGRAAGGLEGQVNNLHTMKGAPNSLSDYCVLLDPGDIFVQTHDIGGHFSAPFGLRP
jgi:hypothetical protein